MTTMQRPQDDKEPPWMLSNVKACDRGKIKAVGFYRTALNCEMVANQGLEPRTKGL